MIKRTKIADNYSISKIIKGGWQLAGGHGVIDHEQAIADMLTFYDAGITTFDCADIYTGVEELIGEFLQDLRKKRGTEAMQRVQVHTKYVPDLDSLARLTRQDVRRIVVRSIERLGVQQLSLVQFHWWDFTIPGYIEAAQALSELRREGLIQHVGVTNFDRYHLQELLEAGVPIASNQVQYSVLDNRPEKTMTSFCKAHDIALLCYGTLAGGLLSAAFLGANEPSESQLDSNRSLIKYKLIIDECGGWEYFQAVLSVLKEVADKHDTSISQIAVKYVLEKPQVAAVIVGARSASHLESLAQLSSMELTRTDKQKLESVLARAKGLGEVYGLERSSKKHKEIMKYNLNEEK